MFEQSFKNIDDVLHRDAGVGTELDYIEQTSWILFLKYLNDFEEDKKTEAALAGKSYKYIIEPKYRWEFWASPKTVEGKLDHNKALSGDDLTKFVDHELFPYLKKFKTSAESPDTIEYKIGEIFSELKNKIQSGYALRNILDIVDGMHFRTDSEKHEMSHLYESKIKNMGNAGRNGGEFYTPRALIKTIVKVVAPKIGEKIYDGAVGSAGFLVEAYNYLKESKKLTTSDVEILQKKTFYGKEIKSLAYIIGIMNMILHGIEAPNIIHTNTLAENIMDIQEKDRFDIVLANPPFGAGIRKEIQQNFPIKTGETAFLFLQHFIKILKAGGRAGIVIKNTFLSNTDNASVSLRKLLLESCNLHTVLDLPGGTFTGAGVKTVILFFEKGQSTKKTWFYQLNLTRNLGKTNPLNEKDLEEFVILQKTKANSPNSWIIDTKDVNQKTFDLSVKNPNKQDEQKLREPKEILEEIEKLNKQSNNNLNLINKIIIEKTTNNDLTKKWVNDIENIRGEIHDLLTSRYQIREIEKMYKTNKNLLTKGSFFWQYFKINYTYFALSVICRQTDNDFKSLSLINLIDEILQSSVLLYNLSGELSLIDKKDINMDRKKLLTKTNPLREFRNKRIAHLSNDKEFEYEISGRLVNEALDFIEKLVIKYRAKITGGYMTTLLSSNCSDFLEAFLFPWMNKK